MNLELLEQILRGVCGTKLFYSETKMNYNFVSKSVYMTVFVMYGAFVLSMADLGRFEENFSIGFQLRTLDQTALIFYLFSRRLEDVFAVQMIDGKVS